MKPEFWRRVEELFHAALERAPEERRGFLDDACCNDADLRQHVEQLLANDLEAKSFLESAHLDDDSMPTATGLIGREFGPYRVVSLLGAGISPETAKRDWRMAKAWLFSALTGDNDVR
jgi:eukaryotic-like serine/threonine-protein kinase